MDEPNVGVGEELKVELIDSTKRSLSLSFDHDLSDSELRVLKDQILNLPYVQNVE